MLAVPPALATAISRPNAVRAATHPLVALPIWLATYFLWHLPPAYDSALRHRDSLLHAEHASYVFAGCLLWWPVVHDRPWSLPPQRRAFYLVAAFVLVSPLGLLLTLLPSPAYDFYDGFRRWHVSALDDQRAAGVLMTAAEAVVFFVAFSYWFLRFLSREDDVPRGR